MSRLSQRDQGRQRVTDDGQPEPAEPRTWQSRQLERQARHQPPGLPPNSQHSRQSAHRENGHRERPVCPVGPSNRLGQPSGAKFPHGTFKPGSCALNHRPTLTTLPGSQFQRRPRQRRGAEVARTVNGISPTSVAILVRRQPIQASAHQKHLAPAADATAPGSPRRRQPSRWKARCWTTPPPSAPLNSAHRAKRPARQPGCDSTLSNLCTL